MPSIVPNTPPTNAHVKPACVNPAHYDAQDGAIAVKNELTLDAHLHAAGRVQLVDGVPTVVDGSACSRKWRTICIDPPWSYRQKWMRGTDDFYTGEKRKGRGAAANYACMTQAALAALPVGAWAEDDAHLYLWSTNAFLAQAHELASAWGFEQKTVITWVKTQIGMGVYFRNTTEHLLFCVRGKLPTRRKNQPTHIIAARTRHSAKPEAAYDMIETMSPPPYLDVFARRARPNWSVAGNEVYSAIPELAYQPPADTPDAKKSQA